MKKQIASILAAVFIFSAVTAGASAQSRISGINAELAKDEIHILYNDKMVRYDDVKPVNNEDRVMIPFRAALESMGASVQYDDSQRLVTAQKGNITIRFTLLDDTIYINNNGSESEMKMDVPMIIVQDRTMVPIRFMSNALGMQVGWDGDSQTVVIMDYDTCFDSFLANIPNINKISASSGQTFNKGQFSSKFAVADSTRHFSLDVNGETHSADGVSGAEGMVSLEKNSASAKNLPLSLIIRDNKIYVKTDSLSKLSGIADSDAVKKAAESSVEWYSVDIDKIFAAFGVSDYTSALRSAFTAHTKLDMAAILSDSMTKDGDAVYSEAINLAMTMDFYEQLDKYLEVSVTDGGYTIKFEAQPKDFVDILCEIMNVSLTDEQGQQLEQQMNYSLSAAVKCDGGVRACEISLKMGEATENSAAIELLFSDTSEYDAAVKASAVPTDSYDITDLVLSFISFD